MSKKRHATLANTEFVRTPEKPVLEDWELKTLKEAPITTKERYKNSGKVNKCRYGYGKCSICPRCQLVRKVMALPRSTWEAIQGEHDLPLPAVEPGPYTCFLPYKNEMGHLFKAGDQLQVLKYYSGTDHVQCVFANDPQTFHLNAETIRCNWLPAETLQLKEAVGSKEMPEEAQTEATVVAAAVSDPPQLETTVIPEPEVEVVDNMAQYVLMPAGKVENNYTAAEPAWVGSKMAGDAYKRIISEFPPHELFVSGFAGHCAVTMHKRVSPHTLLLDLDPAAVGFWQQQIQERFRYKKNHEIASFRVEQHDFFDFYVKRKGDSPHTLLYLDPPYMFSTRKGQQALYKHELTDEQHHELIKWSAKQRCMIAISHPPHARYNWLLTQKSGFMPAVQWRAIYYQVPTHGGLREEALYMNYPAPLRLHDARYIGRDYIHRQQIKRKQQSLLGKLEEMPPQERYALLELIRQRWSLYHKDF